MEGVNKPQRFLYVACLRDVRHTEYNSKKFVVTLFVTVPVTVFL